MDTPITFYVPASSAASAGTRGTMHLGDNTLELCLANKAACSLPLHSIPTTEYRSNLFSTELVLTVTSAPRECFEYMVHGRLRLRFCRTQSTAIARLAAFLESGD